MMAPMAAEGAGGAVPVLEARGVTKSYAAAPFSRPRAVLRDLDVAVLPGEVVALVGPNGAGKTTALRLLAGLVRPDAGEVRLPGVPGAIGYLAEEDGLPLDLSPREILATHAAALRARGVAVDPDAAAAAAGLAARARHRVRTFSKGMRRRLGLAVALLGRPALLLLDEPTAALDPWGRADVRAAITARSAEGAAVLVATQDLDEAERIAARVLLLVGGSLRAEARVADLRAAGRGLEGWALEATARRSGEGAP